jgi:hypothetical protein
LESAVPGEDQLIILQEKEDFCRGSYLSHAPVPEEHRRPMVELLQLCVETYGLPAQAVEMAVFYMDTVSFDGLQEMIYYGFAALYLACTLVCSQAPSPGLFRLFASDGDESVSADEFAGVCNQWLQVFSFIILILALTYK